MSLSKINARTAEIEGTGDLPKAIKEIVKEKKRTNSKLGSLHKKQNQRSRWYQQIEEEKKPQSGRNIFTECGNSQKAGTSSPPKIPLYISFLCVNR